MNNRLAFIIKTPLQQRAYVTKVQAFQTLAIRGRICCRECGDRRWDVLHADHVNNDGYKHRKKLGKGGGGAGKRVYHWIIRNPKTARKKFQLLCANCHQLKTIYGFVPDNTHELEKPLGSPRLRWRHNRECSTFPEHEMTICQLQTVTPFSVPPQLQDSIESEPLDF